MILFLPLSESIQHLITNRIRMHNTLFSVILLNTFWPLFDGVTVPAGDKEGDGGKHEHLTESK